MTDKKLPRRERDKLRQRREILAAALDLFSEKGFHNVCICEIAEKAEFAIGTLYKFFQNKEDLYKALVLEECEKYHDMIVRILDAPGDEIDKLCNYVRVKGELFCSNLPFVRLYVTESRGVSFSIKATGVYEEVRKSYYDFLERLIAVIDSGIRNKRFRKIAEPRNLAFALDSVVNTFLLLWLESPERHPYPENPETILNIFFKGMVEA